ncbi:hypothetical protein [Bacillus cereus]|uniref:hypothetical protein n=1 Tax=Bacillus cereus TaxID=1396 RepID=UPI000BFA14C3|nr:hypothetical protein [Bacillus cereus]PFA76906.1 hypothetical protein CN406_17830 [Bacillus cereus]
MHNSHDSKRRPEVGIADMIKHEFGGLEIQEKLTNGYLMYVPYGIHCDIFESMEASIRVMSKKIEELHIIFQNISDTAGEVNESMENHFQEQIDELRKHKYVLENIVSIKHEI